MFLGASQTMLKYDLLFLILEQRDGEFLVSRKPGLIELQLVKLLTTLYSKTQVKVIEDLFLGDITRSIADHNDKMPSHLRLRIPYAVPHIGYEADGVSRRQTEACAAVFLSVILGEGAIAGSEIRHALRPIDVSPEGSDQLEHDLLNHFLGRGTVGREPSEIYLSLDDTRRARELSFIPVDHDGSIQCGTKPGLLDFSAEWVDLSRYNLTNSRTAAEHRRRARSTRAITRWAYTL